MSNVLKCYQQSSNVTLEQIVSFQVLFQCFARKLHIQGNITSVQILQMGIKNKRLIIMSVHNV